MTTTESVRDEWCAEYVKARDELTTARAELAEAVKIVRKCHDERDAAMTAERVKDARIAELEAQVERTDAEYSRTCKSADDVLARAELADAELDISREAHRMVQSALLSHAAETERVEAELAAIKKDRSEFWAHPELKARAERAEARVAELEGQLSSAQTVRKMNAAVAELSLANTDLWKERAERAEAELKAMREALTGLITGAAGVETIVRSISYNIANDLLKLINKARAALPPSPAGDKR